MSSPAPRNGSEDVLDLLSREHQRLLALLDAAFAATGTQRYRTMQQLRARLQAHLSAEHRVIDPVVRERLDGGRSVLGTLREYEDGMRRVLQELAGLGDYAEEYADVLTCFETHLLGHVAVADSDLYPALRDATSPAERQQLAGQFRTVPAATRPRWPLNLLRAS